VGGAPTLSSTHGSAHSSVDLGDNEKKNKKKMPNWLFAVTSQQNVATKNEESKDKKSTHQAFWRLGSHQNSEHGN
jgi:hypothetical protein